MSLDVVAIRKYNSLRGSFFVSASIGASTFACCCDRMALPLNDNFCCCWKIVGELPILGENKSSLRQ